MNTRIDINCDLGESYGAFRIGNDARIMPYITSASIACGFHAGDPITMAQTVHLAKKSNVAIGAHPSFPDLMGFGRREMQLTSEEVKNYIIYQVSAVAGFAEAVGMRLQHVKPHGALYNMAAEDGRLSMAIAKGIHALRDDLIVFAPRKSELAKAATRTGLRVAYEFFADRAYNPDGTLVSRKHANSLLQEPRQVVQRAIEAVVDGIVPDINGKALDIGEVQTVCVHGDASSAVKLAAALKAGFVKADITVSPIGSFI